MLVPMFAATPISELYCRGINGERGGEGRGGEGLRVQSFAIAFLILEAAASVEPSNCKKAAA